MKVAALALALVAFWAGPALAALAPGDHRITVLWKVLWKFTGTGHVWPGGVQDHLVRLLGPSTALVDANLEMWRFFQRFTIEGSRAGRGR